MFNLELFTTIIGFIAAACSITSSIPQIVEILRTKSAKNISLFTYSILLNASLCWTIYGFLRNDLQIIITNVFCFVIILATFLAIVYYASRSGSRSISNSNSRSSVSSGVSSEPGVSTMSAV